MNIILTSMVLVLLIRQLPKAGGQYGCLMCTNDLRCIRSN